jgi:hypothetical protein
MGVKRIFVVALRFFGREKAGITENWVRVPALKPFSSELFIALAASSPE